MKINSQYGIVNISSYAIKKIEKSYHSKETDDKKYNLNKQNKQKNFNEILDDKIAKTK